jgi:outer membrane protein assembly factor BamB
MDGIQTTRPAPRPDENGWGTRVAPPRRAPGNWALVLALPPLLLFFGLASYEKFGPDRPRLQVDHSLTEELASAVFLDDEPAPAEVGWPQWRGPNRDGVAHDPDLLTTWPRSGPRQMWRVKGGGGYSSFAVQDGRAYTMLQDGAKEVVVCLSAEDGKDVWRHAYESGREPQFPGPRATPTLDEGRLYTVGATGGMYCFDAASGRVLWQHDLKAEFQAAFGQWGAASSPLVEGRLVLANPGGPGGNSVVAFDKVSGERVWSALDDPPAYSSPIAFTLAGVRQVVFFTTRGVVGLSAGDGKELWRYPWETEFNVNAATPLAFRARVGQQVFDYVFISSGYGKGCALLKVSPSGAGQFKVELVYEGNQLRSHFATPVRHGAYVYGFDNSMLVCLDLRTGEVCWKQRGFDKGSLLCVDDYLLVLGEDGLLALAEADPTEYREQARARPFSGRSWTLPALAGGRLFLRNESELLCLDLRKAR